MQKIKIEGGQTIHAVKFSILKMMNPITNKESSTATDFSFTVWGENTADYLISAKKLKKEKFQQIFDDALCLTSHTKSRGFKQAIDSAANQRSRSHHAELYSNSSSNSDQENRPGDVNLVRASGSGTSSKQNGAGDYADADDSQARFRLDDDYAGAHLDLGYSDW